MSFRGRPAQNGDVRPSISTRGPPPPIITKATNESSPTAARPPAISTSVAPTASSHSSARSVKPSSALSPHHLAPPRSISSAQQPPTPLSPLSSSSLPTLHSGVLKKKSPTSLTYDKRHFTLSTHFLSYFKAPSDRFPLGYLSLAEVMSISSGSGTIELGMREAGSDGKERKYKLLADTREEGEVWRQKIEAAVVALRKEEAARKLSHSHSLADDDMSPRTPMALKRRISGSDSSDWKDEPSELEKSFFQLKFSGKRGGSLCRLLMEVRTNLDILRFLIELLLDTQDMRQGTLMALSDDYFRSKRQAANGSTGFGGFTLPPSLALAVAASTSTSTAAPSSTSPTGHHRIASAIDANSQTVEEHKEKSKKSTSNPTSPLASPRISVVPADMSRLRTTSVISSTAFASKMKQMNDKLASYSLIVASLSFDDKAYLLSWLLSASTTTSLAVLLEAPNSVVHDRVLRVLYLCCIVQVKREKAVKLAGGEESWIYECVGDRFAALMKKHIGRVTLPSFQLQLFQSLLAMMTTPLSAFAHPLFMTNLSFANTRLHHPQLLRALFASLFHTEFHLRKKVLKDLTVVLSGQGHGTALLRERESVRWLMLMIADVPLRARRKTGVVRKVTEYVMKAITQLHVIAFKGREERIEPEEKAASEKGAVDGEPRQPSASPFPFFSAPSFPDLVARSLLLSSISSPKHFHGTSRSLLLHLISSLLHNMSLFYSQSSSPSSTSASPRTSAGVVATKQMDATCWSNLLHVLLMVKLFVFVPSRYRDLIASAELNSKAGSAARVRSPSDVTTGSTPPSHRGSVAHPALATSSSAVIDLISSSALNSTMKNDNPHDPYLLDLPALVNLQLAPLPHEKITQSSPKTKTKVVAAAATSLLPAGPGAPSAASGSSELDFVPGSSDRYDVHRLERRGLKADAELLCAVARLLQALSEQQWQPLQSATVKGGVKLNERLEVELSFFQDANVFLLLLAPMVSTETVPSPTSANTTLPSSSSSDALGASMTITPTTTATSSAPTATTPAFTSSLLTPAETAEIVAAFIVAKPNSRRKVFRHYEMKFRSREQAEHKAAETRSKLIEQQMLADAEKERLVTRILLLGTAEAGKSTLFKQTQRVFGSGSNAHTRQQHVVMVLANLLRAMRAIIYHSDRLLVRFPFSALSNTTGSSTTTISPSVDGNKDFISQMDLLQHFPSLQTNNAGKIIPQAVSPSLTSTVSPSETFSSLLQLCLSHLANLWSDLGVQLTYENRAKFDHHQLYDSDGYFLSRLSTLQDIRWLPTDEDIIRTRVRSLGVQQYQWEDGSGQRYRMTDVAGQRSERKKWFSKHITQTHANKHTISVIHTLC